MSLYVKKCLQYLIFVLRSYHWENLSPFMRNIREDMGKCPKPFRTLTFAYDPRFHTLNQRNGRLLAG